MKGTMPGYNVLAPMLLLSGCLLFPLAVFAQAGQQSAPSGTEVVVPDRTLLYAKTRAEFTAVYGHPERLELEVMDDVMYRARVLIPKKAKLLAEVVSVDRSTQNAREIVTVLIKVVRAEWKGGYAKLNAGVVKVFAVWGPGDARHPGTVYRPQGTSPAVYGQREPSPIADPDMTAKAGPPPGWGGQSDAYKSVRVVADGKMELAKPFSLHSGSVLELQHRDADAGSVVRQFKPPTQSIIQPQHPNAEAGSDDRRASPEEQFQQGLMMHKERKYSEAAEAYRKAAEAGFAMAQNNLAVLYAQGQGVAQDYVAAHMWFTIAGTAKPDKNRPNLQLLESHMTPEQIAESQRRAEEWLRQHPSTH